MHCILALLCHKNDFSLVFPKVKFSTSITKIILEKEIENKNTSYKNTSKLNKFKFEKY